ncbi:ubiquitin carboxyl-terminal hydrolase 8-like isoform X2 [Microplitis mediator]|uniref:ubiquitin carboxyl-terminal hydrolase 8-like isoform X2 n=1 Tax=Microplitis mediator TaxID=375433 RepID=UPI002556C1EF|nr:ubiquitin carboxyl-terminal hydrolase 8-like isoform X2 [Microplitis mediator]
MSNDCENSLITRLNNKAKVDFTNKKLKDVASRLPMIYEEGLKNKNINKYESSYVFFKRYLNIVAWAKKQKAYNDAPNNYQQIVPKQIEEVKALVDSLLTKLKSDQQVISEPKNKKQDEDSYLDKLSSCPDIPDDEPVHNNNNNNNNNVIKINNNNNINNNSNNKIINDSDNKNQLEGFIKCQELFPAISNSRTLILDVRPENDYKLSRIQARNCINIPESCIHLGSVATKYSNYIKDPNDVTLYEERSKQYIDLLVLVDWHTTHDKLKPSSPIALMKEILTKWDPGKTKGDLVMLEGGFNEWINVYPQFVTDPNVTCPSDWDDHPEYDVMPKIEYPSYLNTDPKRPESTTGRFNPKRITEINETLDEISNSVSRLSQDFNQIDIDTSKSNSFDNNSDNDDTRTKFTAKVKTSMPVIDRTKKPTNKDPDILEYFEILKQRNDLAEYQEKLENQWYRIEQGILELVKDDVDTAEKIQERNLVKETLEKILTDKKYNKRQVNDKKVSLKNKLAYCSAEETKLDIRYGDIENRIKETQLKREEVLKNIEKIITEREEFNKNKTNKYDNEIYKEPLKSEDATVTINSDLKRSLSSPNLAQYENLKKPTFDRSSKPSDLRKNQYGNNYNKSVDDSNLSHMKPVFMDNMQRGTTGLKNLGNSCYMSSIIQCLSNTPYLSTYFRNNSYEDALSKNGSYGKNEKLVTAFAQVIKSLWTGTIRHISPIELKLTLGSLSNAFGTNEQQDSHEFLILLLEWMHLALRTDNKEIRPNTPMTEAEKQYQQSLEGKRSVLSELFNGQSRSTCTCISCGFHSETYETFNSLTLSVPENSPCELYDCIGQYLSEQSISEWKCPKCKVARPATKKCDFVKLPPIIIIHLNRFSGTDGIMTKKNTYVKCPLVNLKLRHLVANDSTKNYSYDLYGLSHHIGGIHGGHYTAYCKNNQKWFKYDDDRVSAVSESDVKNISSSAYLLFYSSIRHDSFINSH